MKDFKQIKLFGKITVALNILLVVLAFVGAITLLSFDQPNKEAIQRLKPLDRALEMYGVDTIEAHRVVKEYDFKSHRMDSLSQVVKIEKDKTKKTKIQEYLEKNKEDLKTKKENKDKALAKIETAKQAIIPLQADYDIYQTQADSAYSKFCIILILMIVLFVIKIVMIMMINFKQSKFLHTKVNWMINKPLWAILSWIIPVYNLFKPYKVFSEIWEETDYYLYSNGKIEDKGRESGDLLMGTWWAFLLIVLLGISYIVYSTFFLEGAMFLKLSHTNVVYFAAIMWLLYAFMESWTVLSLNKLYAKMEE